ncbi:hypothetical protein IMM1_31800 [Pseudocoprococcus immobilis]
MYIDLTKMTREEEVDSSRSLNGREFPLGVLRETLIKIKKKEHND